MSTRDHKPSRAELQNGRLLWRAVPRTAVLFGSGVGTLLLLVASAMAQDKPSEAIKIDKEKKTVTIACKVALRKLPNLSEIYPKTSRSARDNCTDYGYQNDLA